MNCETIEPALSGYLDRELTQQQQQKISIHLEECPACRALLEELASLKTSTRNLHYQEPSDREWKTMEQNIFERISRSLGWLIVVVWTTVTAGYAAFQFATSPFETLFQKILVFGIFLGFALVFLSVLSERIRASRTDPYKGVRR